MCKIENCKRENLLGDDYCILHSKNENKNPKEFKDIFDKLAGLNGLTTNQKKHLNSVVFVISINLPFYRNILFENCTFTKKVDFIDKTFTEIISFKNCFFNEEFNFYNVTFNQQVDFSNSTFKKDVNFINCKFLKDVNFEYAIFNENVNFTNVAFNDKANFSVVKFIGKANFIKSIFNKSTYFNLTTFTNNANFNETTFNIEVNFWETKFNVKANFTKVIFNKETDFWNATFNDKVDFIKTIFNKETDFWETIFNDKADFSYSQFKDKVNFRDIKTKENSLFNFSHTFFKGRTLFWGQNEQIFKNIFVDFKNVSVEPKVLMAFRNVDLKKWNFAYTDVREFEFTDVEFDKKDARLIAYETKEYKNIKYNFLDDLKNCFRKQKIKNNELITKCNVFEKLYRELRFNYENRKEYMYAGDFHYWEKENILKNPNTHWGNKIILFLYKFFSGYSESVFLPILWLFVICIGFAFLYIYLGSFELIWESFAKALIHSLQLITFTRNIENSNEILGFNNVTSPLFLFFEVIQRIISPIFLTLLILSIRQRLKR